MKTKYIDEQRKKRYSTIHNTLSIIRLLVSITVGVVILSGRIQLFDKVLPQLNDNTQTVIENTVQELFEKGKIADSMADDTEEVINTSESPQIQENVDETSENNTASPEIEAREITKISPKNSRECVKENYLSYCKEAGEIRGIPLYTFGGVTESDIERIQKETEELPNVLFETDIYAIILTTRRITNIYDGLQNGSSTVVGLTDYDNGLVWVNVKHDVPYVLAHELVHAWDYYVTDRISKSSEFEAIYSKEGTNSYVCKDKEYEIQEYMALASEKYFGNPEELEQKAPETYEFLHRYFRKTEELDYNNEEITTFEEELDEIAA